MESRHGRVSTVPPLSRYSSLAEMSSKKNQDGRPQTSPSFPDRRSKNPFFVRNAPHPIKVRHLKGLLDAPVCMVDDTLYDVRPSSRQTKKHQLNRSFLNMKREKFLPGIGMGNLNIILFE